MVQRLFVVPGEEGNRVKRAAAVQGKRTRVAGRSFKDVEELISSRPIEDMARWSSGLAIVQERQRQEGMVLKVAGPWAENGTAGERRVLNKLVLEKLKFI
jgi:hypothetical protein